MDAATRLGIQVGFDKIDQIDLSEAFVMRFEPYGQIVLSDRRFGVYGMVPIAHVFAFDDDDATGIGNLELGGFLLPLRDSRLVLRAGLTLPTASDSFADFITNLYSAYERATDFVLIAPEHTTLRLSASTLQESGSAFFRGDLGLDLVIDKPNGGEDVFMHANLAAGVRLPSVDLSVEWVNFANVDGSGNLSERMLHTLGFGLRTRGPSQFYAGTVFPLDADLRGEIWIFSFGYQRATN